MSSIMRARSGLTGRGEVAEVIGALSRAEGCWPFDARDRMPRSSRATAHYLVENTLTVPRAPSRASGFVLRRVLVIAGCSGGGPLTEPTAAACPWQREPLTFAGHHHGALT